MYDDRFAITNARIRDFQSANELNSRHTAAGIWAAGIQTFPAGDYRGDGEWRGCFRTDAHGRWQIPLLPAAGTSSSRNGNRGFTIDIPDERPGGRLVGQWYPGSHV